MRVKSNDEEPPRRRWRRRKGRSAVVLRGTVEDAAAEQAWRVEAYCRQIEAQERVNIPAEWWMLDFDGPIRAEAPRQAS